MTRIEIPPIPVGGTNQKVAVLTDANGDSVQAMQPFMAAASTITKVAVNVASVTILAANVKRTSAVILNDSESSKLRIKEGTTAAADDFSYLVLPLSSVQITGYSGQLDGIWDVADGAGKARVTERAVP